jgi:hypothetical protein
MVLRPCDRVNQGASDFGSEGWGFESLRARYVFFLRAAIRAAKISRTRIISDRFLKPGRAGDGLASRARLKHSIKHVLASAVGGNVLRAIRWA